MMGYWGYGYGSPFGFAGIFGGIFMLIFWIFLIALIVSAFRRARWADMGEREDRSLEILRERYAKGEINRQEFEEKKKDLLAK